MFNKENRTISFVISAPAGTGKTTLVDYFLQNSSGVKKHISYTTRKPRQGEKNGEDYWFLTEKEFFAKKEDFLETVCFMDEQYATSKSQLKENEEKLLHTIFVIDTQGAIRLKKELDCVTIFLLPPSYSVLQQRLSDRNTETEELINQKLKIAEKELEMLPFYDYYIVNTVLEDSCATLRNIIAAEEHKTKNLRIPKYG